MRQMTELDDYVHAGPRYTMGGFNKGNGQGLSMRDYFAGQAMLYIMGDKRVGSYDYAAEESYKMADAMLEARKTTGEDNK
jgi:hypothetical protein